MNYNGKSILLADTGFFLSNPDNKDLIEHFLFFNKIFYLEDLQNLVLLPDFDYKIDCFFNMFGFNSETQKYDLKQNILGLVQLILFTYGGKDLNMPEIFTDKPVSNSYDIKTNRYIPMIEGHSLVSLGFNSNEISLLTFMGENNCSFIDGLLFISDIRVENEEDLIFKNKIDVYLKYFRTLNNNENKVL